MNRRGIFSILVLGMLLGVHVGIPAAASIPQPTSIDVKMDGFSTIFLDTDDNQDGDDGKDNGKAIGKDKDKTTGHDEDKAKGPKDEKGNNGKAQEKETKNAQFKNHVRNDFKFAPRVVNLRSQGNWVKVLIHNYVGTGVGLFELVVSTDGKVLGTLSCDNAKLNGNNLELQFDRSELIFLLNSEPGEYTVEITEDGAALDGTDTFTAILSDPLKGTDDEEIEADDEAETEDKETEDKGKGKNKNQLKDDDDDDDLDDDDDDEDDDVDDEDDDVDDEDDDDDVDEDLGNDLGNEE